HLESMVKNKGKISLGPQEVIDDAPKIDITNVRLSSPPNYKLGDSIATRLAYGTALIKIAENNPRVIALDGDTKNSTFSCKIKEVTAKYLPIIFDLR
ncbi:hypothetical protein J6590_102644, partial [Homalodisca vitripennis]